jgi:hypothetical protein
MKTYKAYTDRADAAGAVVYLVEDPEATPRTYLLRHLRVHSPSGMNHGYGGSGPADLALSILADYLGEATAIPPHDDYDPAIARRIERTTAWALHQHFKWDVIARLDQAAGFTLVGDLIAAWLYAHDRGDETGRREETHR